jgi:hypothetical protein
MMLKSLRLGAIALLVVCVSWATAAWKPRVVEISVPSSLVEGKTSTVVVAFPPGYGLRRSQRWVLWIHGTNEGGAGMFDSYGRHMSSRLLRAGYVLVSPDDSDRTCWGDAACVQDIRETVTAVRDRFHLTGDPYVYAMSMGGLVALNSVAHGALHPRALFASYPVYSLASMEVSQFGFADSIRRAFQGQSMSGFDPAADDPARFASFPIEVACSSGDTTVICARNGRALVSAVQGAGGSVAFYPCAGNHGDASCIPPAAAVAFFHRH